jgi:hypothetical protein
MRRAGGPGWGLMAGLAAALLAVPGGLAAADGAAGTSMPSLTIPLDARAVGMGSAYTAVASGADSLEWNPAGMDQLHYAQAEAGHLAWVQDVNDEYLDVAFPLYGLGAWGLGTSYLYTQDQYYDDVGNAGGTFTDFDFSAEAAFSLQIGDTQNLGIEYKILRQGYATQFDMGSCFDFGWQWRDVWPGFDLGAAAENLGTPLSLGSAFNALPIDLKVGGDEHLGSLVLLAVDEEYQPIDSFNFVHAGIEVGTQMGDMTPMIRAGYILGPADEADGGITGLTAGLGLAVGAWQVDYAYAPQGDLGTAQRLTLTWNGGD